MGKSANVLRAFGAAPSGSRDCARVGGDVGLGSGFRAPSFFLETGVPLRVRCCPGKRFYLVPVWMSVVLFEVSLSDLYRPV